MPSIARRTLFRATAAAAFALTAVPAAFAQGDTSAWPQHPITMIMTFNAGSGVDVVARLIQEPVSKILGQPVIIDYKPGAAGNIASEYVSRAKPDGYTMVFGTGPPMAPMRRCTPSCRLMWRPTSRPSRPWSRSPMC